MKTKVEKVARCRLCKEYIKDKKAVGFYCQHFFHEACAENFVSCPECKVYLRVGEILEVHFSDGTVKYGLVVSESETSEVRPQGDVQILTFEIK